MTDLIDYPFEGTNSNLPFAPGSGAAKRLQEIEELFDPLSLDNVESMGLTGLILVSWPDASVRLTSKGRHYYRDACEMMGVSPRRIRTLKQFEQIRRLDAELLLQRLADAELEHFRC